MSEGCWTVCSRACSVPAWYPTDFASTVSDSSNRSFRFVTVSKINFHWFSRLSACAVSVSRYLITVISAPGGSGVCNYRSIIHCQLWARIVSASIMNYSPWPATVWRQQWYKKWNSSEDWWVFETLLHKCACNYIAIYKLQGVFFLRTLCCG